VPLHGETMSRAFILDSSSIQYRAYHASKERPTYTKDGVPNAAVNLYRTMIARMRREWKPDYLVAACDTSRNETFRTKLYPLYKAQRSAPPVDYVKQLSGFRALLESEFIPIFEKEGFEADDIIGTLCQRIRKDSDVVIVSGDKDMAQLVSVSHDEFEVSLLNTNKNKILNVVGVLEEYGVWPHQVVDYLAMVGDTSDNVPGARGLGPKGARALLEQFGSLDEIIKRSAEIRNKGWRHAIEDNLTMIALSRQLVKIETGVAL